MLIWSLMLKQKGASLLLTRGLDGSGLPGDHEKNSSHLCAMVVAIAMMTHHTRKSGVSFSFRVTFMNCPDSQAVECS